MHDEIRCSECGGAEFHYSFRQFPMTWTCECVNCGARGEATLLLEKKPPTKKPPPETGSGYDYWPYS